jgi:Xaa-Pro aminopeptidase
MEPNNEASSIPPHALIPHALISDIDFDQLNSDRLDRLQAVMRQEAVPACLFFHPANIRYATGTAVMDVHTLGASERYCLVPADGEPILFEWDCGISQSRKLVRDVRPALWWQYQGQRGDVLVAQFASEIRDALNELGVGERNPVGIDRADSLAVFALQNAGINLISASKVTDRAREIKTPWEVALMRINGRIGCEMLAEFETAIRPGIREFELLAVLSDALLRRRGVVVFTRLVSSGQNTNPWGKEASDKIVRSGDLVALDTDANGYEGYVIDVSRTFLCGSKPTTEQKELYRVAYDYIAAMREAVRPGISYAEFAHSVPALPDEYAEQSYGCMVHGAGLQNEGPVLHNPGGGDNPEDEYLQENMVMCLEAYVGRVGGACGVKLEDQVLVSNSGAEILVDYPYDKRLLG